MRAVKGSLGHSPRERQRELERAAILPAQWGTHPGHPGNTYASKLGRGIFIHSPAAFLGTRRVLARQGWAGEKSGLFEHPATILTAAP